MTANESEEVPAGWYEDPRSSGRYLRFWDGEEWTKRLTYPGAGPIFEDQNDAPTGVPTGSARDPQLVASDTGPHQPKTTSPDQSGWQSLVIMGVLIAVVGGAVLHEYLTGFGANAAHLVVAIALLVLGHSLLLVGLVAKAVELGTRKLRAEMRDMVAHPDMYALMNDARGQRGGPTS